MRRRVRVRLSIRMAGRRTSWIRRSVCHRMGMRMRVRTIILVIVHIMTTRATRVNRYRSAYALGIYI